MLEPHEIEDIKFSESNADEWLLIEHRGVTFPDGRWGQAAFVHHSDVIQLRDWLNNWLGVHNATS